MYPYVVIAWSHNNQRVKEEAHRVTDALSRSSDPTWNALVNADGLTVYGKPPNNAAISTYILPGNHGVILGRLFASEEVVRPMQLSELPYRAIVETRGQWLLQTCWGKYIAILRTDDGEKCYVLRDCSGQLPCFYLDLNGIYIFFSDIRDIACLHLPLTLNESYLVEFISRQPFHVRETGLKEITELLAGDCVTIGDTGVSHESIWNPRSTIADRMIDSYAQARSVLITMTEDVINAWAQFSQRILLSLSGGLDSAIVLGCLQKLGLTDKTVCVIQYTGGTSDDERLYARAAARMAGVTLIEMPRLVDGRKFAELLSSVPPDPRPDISKTVRIVATEGLNDVANEFGTDTIWTGQGGDQIYRQTSHLYGAADHLIQHPYSWQLPRVIYDTALLSRRSVWDVLAEAVAYRFLKNRSPPALLAGRGQRFLAKNVAQASAVERLANLWRVGKEPIPPGKLDQLDTFFDLLNRHKPLVGLETPYEQHPLISQPLIEHSLRIPTYHLLRGGRQRAMARDAFSDRLPSCILEREDKGSIPDQMRSFLREGAPVIREKLLDGILASRGIFNRTALDGILRHDETFATDDVFPLFACIAAEAWAQHWTTGSVQAAAA